MYYEEYHIFSIIQHERGQLTRYFNSKYLVTSPGVVELHAQQAQEDDDVLLVHGAPHVTSLPVQLALQHGT
jgi:hypothetical protein